MHEVSIQGGGYFIPKLAQALATASEDGDADPEGTHGQDSQLLCWGKVGRMVRRAVPPGQQHQNAMDKAELRVRTAPLLSFVACYVLPRMHDHQGSHCERSGIPAKEHLQNQAVRSLRRAVLPHRRCSRNIWAQT